MAKADDSANASFRVEHKKNAFLIKRLGNGRQFRIVLEGGGQLPRELCGTYMKQEDARYAISFYQARQDVIESLKPATKAKAPAKQPAEKTEDN